jgi:formate dehydrogenase alpha subunit
MLRIEIDGQQVEMEPGCTILDVANQIGIDIPTLCHHPDLSPAGACRLCIVEVEGRPRPETACNTHCVDGMRVRTDSHQVEDERRMILEMTLESFRSDGELAAADNEFSRLLDRYGLQPQDMQASDSAHSPKRFIVDSDPNPFIRIDLNQCILCSRCVRACGEVQGRFVWGMAERGAETRLVAGNDTFLLDARCESCGACAAYCPTGALTDRAMVSGLLEPELSEPELSEPELSEPERAVRTTCGYCGVGCQFDLKVKGDRVVGVESTPAAPVNGMSLCVKGRYGYDYVHHADRLTRPKVREYLLTGRDGKNEQRQNEWREVSWDTALDLVAGRFATMRRESGERAVGVLSSAKCTNEENFLMQKFARQVMRTNSVDHCARLCHSSTVAGLAMAMGSGAMSNSMDDIAQHAEAILIIGSNTTEQHPVFGAMLRQAALRGTSIVVADPRAIDMVEFARLHVRQRPGSDVALLNGMMNLIIEKGLYDETFIHRRCEDFYKLVETVKKYTPEFVERITGVSEACLVEAVDILSRSKPMAVIWSMGITQHTTGVSNVLSLANLQMLLGNMGVPGGGVNPLRGQNNVQGACDMGALPNVFSGYQRVDDELCQRKFSQAWQIETAVGSTTTVESLPLAPGLTVTEMIASAGAGKLRGLYILGEDPAMTEPDSNHARQCLAAAEFVVLQEIFPSETSVFADVLLPGCSFAEKSGTFTNTERRIQPVRQAIEPLGEARPDWWITAELATRILQVEGRAAVGPHAAWYYQSPDDILLEINSLTPSYAGVTSARIERGDRLQWPVWDPDHAGTPILHVDQFARGKGKFHAIDYLPPAECPNVDFPFLLTTGRVLYHWHGGEMTRRSAGLRAVCSEPVFEISPDDAATKHIQTGDWITLTSRRGELKARARVTTRVSTGVLFANFHFPGSGNANNLTIGALDPIALIPEYKVCAVRIETP